MIKVVDNKVSFEEEAASKCDLCGDIAELRPYGPNGENICCPCGNKMDPAVLEARMAAALDGQLAAAGVSLDDVELVDPDPTRSLLLDLVSKALVFNK